MRFTDLITVLTEVVAGGLQNGQVKLGHGLGGDVGVSVGQMVDQHPSPLEAQHARVTLVDVALVV